MVYYVIHCVEMAIMAQVLYVGNIVKVVMLIMVLFVGETHIYLAMDVVVIAQKVIQMMAAHVDVMFIHMLNIATEEEPGTQ